MIIKAEKKKIINRIINFLIIILIISFIYYTISHILERKRLLNNKNIKFTVGKITNYEVGAKVSPWFVYSFNVDSVKYEGKYSNIDYKMKENKYLYINKYFIVKYSEINPVYNEIYLDKSVDSLGNDK